MGHVLRRRNGTEKNTLLLLLIISLLTEMGTDTLSTRPELNRVLCRQAKSSETGIVTERVD